MVDAFLGKQYKLDHSLSVRFDDYMKALGVGTIQRALGNKIVPTYDLTKSGDEYTLRSVSTFKNFIVTFKLGQELEFETPDGRKVKATFTMDGNKLIEVQIGVKTTTLIREFSATELKVTTTVDDITAVRVYRAV